MAWLRLDDRWNQRPEIRALDDGSYRAFHTAIEAAENFDGCGMVPDDYAMSVYPRARQKLRKEIRKLAALGLVHLLIDPEDHDPDCPTCQTRCEELRGEGAEELRKKYPTSAPTSTQSCRTEPMWFCIRDFFGVAMTPERKRETRRKDADRQRKKRELDKAGLSRRDAEPPSRPPVPVPDPKLRINDHVIASKELEPTSTASPSEPSDLVSWLRNELERRRAACRMPCKWKPEHREHLGDVALKASNSPGDAIGIMSAALDAFFADSSQAKYRYSPAGLAHGFDTYAAEALEQEAQALNDRKRAKRDAELEAIDAAILAADEAKKAKRKAERKAEREANGTSRAGAPGGNLGPDLEGWS